ncbi:Fis family transcriptional regulator [Caldivirga sp.]|uniref:Fis family transcriptional regulator n=1 Tax=Caldivirga sp. TaxID=2080243 RepID=UPI003D133198
MDLEDLRVLMSIVKAKLMGKPLALCDIGDADGLTSAALFLIKYPNGLVTFAPPSKVQRGWLYRVVKWDFVADLPCPGKAVIRADHHRTNKPCAQFEYYDPEAPCSAYMAAKGLNLNSDPRAQGLVKVAIETDTANIVSREAEEIDMAARFSNYGEKVKLAKVLAQEGLGALSEPWVKAIVERGYKAKELMLRIADQIPIDNVVNVYFSTRVGSVSYRQLTIELQRRGAGMVNILVKLGSRTFRYYCGADKSRFDCTRIATALGGGRHPYAAGAQYKAPLFNPRQGFEEFIRVLKDKLNMSKLSLIEVVRDTNGVSVRRLQL